MNYCLLILLALFLSTASAETLPQLITKIKPSVVAIAIYNPTASPRLKLIGSGFVVKPGNQVVTNNHVVSQLLDESKNEQYVVLSGHGQDPIVHPITSKKNDLIYDLAVLKIEATLPAMTLADSEYTPEGTALAFTGYPITGVLGLYPATHQATLSAITPIAIPQDNSQVLSAATLRKLKRPFMVYQLDGTAYPGNSGSALYRKEDGVVVAIINMVLVKSSREAVLSDPSGIAYAIPVNHLHQLLAQP
ncbi:serine protease [Paraglaciecola sp.]|uniref:S1 family peptidase n=1 Tax=Paraglaciecola sp. TaxID=1920173 RepID=UPI00273CFFD5|nr:serine protease [Paraglaciecola sp.]MDP5032414.1 serine protease [Paraglaciecola sp.]